MRRAAARSVHVHQWGRIVAARARWQERLEAIEFDSEIEHEVAEGRADFVPVFLSDIPSLFSNGVIPLDVAIVQLSPPDVHGYCSLGTSVDCARAAVLPLREGQVFDVARETTHIAMRVAGKTLFGTDTLDEADELVVVHRSGRGILAQHVQAMKLSQRATRARRCSFGPSRLAGRSLCSAIDSTCFTFL